MAVLTAIVAAAAVGAGVAAGRSRQKQKKATSTAQAQQRTQIKAQQAAVAQQQQAYQKQMASVRSPGQGTPKTERLAPKRKAYGGGPRSRTVHTSTLGLSTSDKSNATTKTLTGQ
jgi:hypothetical protein